MFSNLFFYKILFSAEILVAEFLFTFRLNKRNCFPLRLAFVCAAVLGISALYPIPFNTFWYSSLMFLVLFSVTLPALRVCYDEPFANLFFCALAAYNIQHFAYETVNVFLLCISSGSSLAFGIYDNGTLGFGLSVRHTVFYILLYLLCYFVSYGLAYWFFARRIKENSDMKIKNLSLFLLITAAFIINILLSFLVTFVHDGGFVSSLVNYLTGMMCCLLLLYCQFSLLLIKEIKREREIMGRLLYQKKEQYAISKETIDLINMKCHDIRHQIREIGKNKSLPDDAIREMEKSISLYDSIVHTGNEALDTILTEKSLLCTRGGIVLTCIADGALLGFMSPTDLYSLFGNALDNAIEAAEKVSDPERRVIGLKIIRVGEMASVNIKNSFEGDIRYNASGYPQTTKENTDYHGYGIKSIAYVVDKYEGNLSIVAQKNIFNLNILLPIPEG